MTDKQILPIFPIDMVHQGGLMRCCLETISDMYPDGPARKAGQGQKLSCKYAQDDPDHQMVFTDGGWRWDHPEDL